MPDLQEVVEELAFMPSRWFCMKCGHHEKGDGRLPCPRDGHFMKRMSWQSYAFYLEMEIIKLGGELK
jgi:hypothetical protein